MMFICLDVEGVLLPEIWIKVAEATGLDALYLTTRDEPDFDALMRHRILTLHKHGVSYSDLAEIASKIDPLPGAKDFLDVIRSSWPCALVSDSFYEFLMPLAPKLGFPTIFCHHLLRDSDDRLSGWRPRLNNQKPAVVKGLQALGFTVAAAGDSFNDLGMLEAADFGFFVNAPPHISQKFPERRSCNGLDELLSAFHGIKAEVRAAA
ncbi:MAG TPA: bifunctional phosphoserine phosphatase/homoserine phosphotransferase ThrH [Noviherbaspirillum sp.]|jgi:phosphoserine/homoserine phosphotransferase|nr:bifunctional phosphoserine phosphatase/homoserine phosphotransferase ThrH [Noviherbaspirillum sp.]